MNIDLVLILLAVIFLFIDAVVEVPKSVRLQSAAFALALLTLIV